MDSIIIWMICICCIGVLVIAIGFIWSNLPDKNKTNPPARRSSGNTNSIDSPAVNKSPIHSLLMSDRPANHCFDKMVKCKELIIQKYLSFAPSSIHRRIELTDHETVIVINDTIMTYFSIRTEGNDFEQQRNKIENLLIEGGCDSYHLHVEELTQNCMFKVNVQGLRNEVVYEAYVNYAKFGAVDDEENPIKRTEYDRLRVKYPELKLTERIKDEITVLKPDGLILHEDIKNLVFVEKKLPVGELYSLEPSTVFLDLPVASKFDPVTVLPLGYYPSYAKMDVRQRAIYLRFLENPFEGEYDLGYVFCLYYGLEAHLCKGDIDGAFDVTMRLKELYDNKSFQMYSNNALALTCLKKHRYDLIEKLVDFIRNSEKPYLSVDIYIMMLACIGSPFTAFDIYKFRGDFGYKNKRYSQNREFEFISAIEDGLMDDVHRTEFDANEILECNVAVERDIKTVYANTKLIDYRAEIPLLHTYDMFYGACNRALNIAHDIMKQRKPGNT